MYTKEIFNRVFVIEEKADVATEKADLATQKADLAVSAADIVSAKAELAAEKAELTSIKADDILTKLDAALDSLKKCPASLIMEATDGTEYMALDAAKKEVYALYVSAGYLDMRVGSRTRDTVFLSYLFPSGTATYTNIINALATLGD